MNVKALATLSLALVSTSVVLDIQPAEAAGWKHSVNNRQQRQRNRIQHGVGSGSLNRMETGRLTKQQAALRRQEARFRASGDGLSAQERMRLQHEQNRLSNNIYEQKHDGQNRVGVPDNNRHDLFDVNQTQRNQENRIYSGIQNGELTRHEANRLDNQQDRLETREAYLRQDGLTLEERKKLDNAQDRMSQNIFEQKHDGQDRD